MPINGKGKHLKRVPGKKTEKIVARRCMSIFLVFVMVFGSAFMDLVWIFAEPDAAVMDYPEIMESSVAGDTENAEEALSDVVV